MKATEKQTSTYKVWRNAFVVVAGLGFAAFFGASAFKDAAAVNDTQASDNSFVQNESDFAATEEFVSEGTVLGESDVSLPGALKSENYTLGQLAVGGDVTIASSDTQDIGPLEITGVRGEAFMNKDKKDVNVLITWKTSKLATASIKYGKNGTDNQKTIEEDGYGLNHSIILTGLDQASAYVYTIVAKDRSANEVSTDAYAVYTGSKSTSLFDLISGAVTDTFGWAIKK